MIQQITANNLASGDVVHFPRVGAAQLLRLVGLHAFPNSAYAGSVTALFDDGRTRTLQLDRKLRVEIAETQPVAGDGQFYRLDLSTKRISVVSRASFTGGFSDVKESFSSRPGRVMSFSEMVAADELEHNAVLFTETAIYAKNIDRIQEFIN